MVVDIRDETAAICQKLGLQLDVVARLDWWPAKLEATVYRLDEKGKKYIVDGEPAMEVRVYEVVA